MALFHSLQFISGFEEKLILIFKKNAMTNIFLTLLTGLHYTIVWPQQTVQLSCWSSMFNGIRPEATCKRFNSAYLQNEFLICRKNFQQYLLTSRNFFLLIISHHVVLEKKGFLKTKKSESDFQLGTHPPSRPSKKKQVALEIH